MLTVYTSTMLAHEAALHAVCFMCVQLACQPSYAAVLCIIVHVFISIGGLQSSCQLRSHNLNMLHPPCDIVALCMLRTTCTITHLIQWRTLEVKRCYGGFACCYTPVSTVEVSE